MARLGNGACLTLLLAFLAVTSLAKFADGRTQGKEGGGMDPKSGSVEDGATELTWLGRGRMLGRYWGVAPKGGRRLLAIRMAQPEMMTLGHDIETGLTRSAPGRSLLTKYWGKAPTAARRLLEIEKAGPDVMKPTLEVESATGSVDDEMELEETVLTWSARGRSLLGKYWGKVDQNT